ncbi:MAG: hypothetical protein LBV34_10920 [Nocardiopsaceae bacterium]|jgi:hypothetical protein|nr:hypothetical protein [Nocardiopsaceae bacterium]
MPQWLVTALGGIVPVVVLVCLGGLVLYVLVRLWDRRRARHERRLAIAVQSAMHSRDDERRARELAWFDAYRRGVGMPDLAPHEWYETAEEYDWDRARLTVLGFEVLESWRHEQQDGSTVFEVLYQGNLDRLQRAAREMAAI